MGKNKTARNVCLLLVGVALVLILSAAIIILAVMMSTKSSNKSQSPQNSSTSPSASTTMAPNVLSNLYKYFPKANHDGLYFGWSHATNSIALLTEALASTSVNLMESDVVYNAADKTVYLAHPPLNTSDLTLELYLSKLSDYLAKNPNTPKGMKLDFKSEDALEHALPVLDKTLSTGKLMNLPLVLINADIFFSKTAQLHVHPEFFFKQAFPFMDKYPSITGFSLGWRFGHSNNYTNDMIDQALTVMKQYTGSRPNAFISYAVRAGYIDINYDLIVKICKSSSKSYLSSIIEHSTGIDNIQEVKVLVFKKQVLASGIPVQVFRYS